MKTWLLSISVLALAFGAAGCPGETAPVPGSEGSVIVGVTSELRAGVDIKRLHVKRIADGEVVGEEDVTAGLAFPSEFPFTNLADGALVEIELGAFGATGPALLTRLASTKVVAGRTLLMPVRLQTSCVSGVPGSSAPACVAPETCVTGVCKPSFVEPAALADYASGWAKAPDPCKPASAGAPTVIVGEGQADYLPMADGDVAQVEAGPQGGYHVWVAIRMKNLRQSGSVTEVTGDFPDLAVPVDPFKVIFTFDQDEGGYCKLPGLRFRLDSEQHKIETLLGKTLHVKVQVTDSEGAVGVGERTVELSDSYL